MVAAHGAVKRRQRSGGILVTWECYVSEAKRPPMGAGCWAQTSGIDVIPEL